MNNDIQETKCSFEVSKLLRQKGFSQRTQSFFFEDGEFRENNIIEATNSDYGLEFIMHHGDSIENWNDNFLTNKSGGRCFGCSKSRGYFETYSSPTHTIAIEWLRVNFGIWINIYFDSWASEQFYWQINQKGNKELHVENSLEYNTPQEATEAALLYALNKLI